MTVEQIHLRIGHLQLVAHELVRTARRKTICVQTALGKETTAVLTEVVVHGGIEHIPIQPVPRRLPDLADQQGIGFRSFDGGAESAPKAIVNLARHI